MRYKKGQLLRQELLHRAGLVRRCGVLNKHDSVLVVMLINPRQQYVLQDDQVLVSVDAKAGLDEVRGHDTALARHHSKHHHRCCIFALQDSGNLRRVIGNDSIILVVGDLVHNELLLINKDSNVTASVLQVTKKLQASLGSGGHGLLHEKSPTSPDIGLHAQILFYHQDNGRAAHISLLGQDGHQCGRVGDDGVLQV